MEYKNLESSRRFNYNSKYLNDFDLIINVSDMESDPGIHTSKYKWFPMSDSLRSKKNISGILYSLSSVYAALSSIQSALQSNYNSKILIHCEAGAYRSPMVVELYRWLDSGVLDLTSSESVLALIHKDELLEVLTFVSVLKDKSLTSCRLTYGLIPLIDQDLIKLDYRLMAKRAINKALKTDSTTLLRTNKC